MFGFKDLFNKEKVLRLERELETANLLNAELLGKTQELEDYKLMYEIAELYIKDDDAILELLEIKKTENNRNNARIEAQNFWNQQNAMQQNAYHGLGQFRYR